MLYIVATPIGNLKDITLRALEILRQVDIILCEDTRVTRKLLERYEIKDKRLISYHQHTKEKKVKELIGLIRENKVALVTDAGTPGISDPGGKIIKSINQEIKKSNIIPIPGVSAVTTALSISGFPTDEFLFLGFIPHKKGRNKFLKQVLESKRTMVFYESRYRIIKCLEQLNTLINTNGNTNQREKKRQLVVCRELTKKFETIYRGNISEVLEQVQDDPVKGEYVIVIY